MAYSDVYIGQLDDPRFSWEEGNWSANIPRPISPYFPPLKDNKISPLRIVIDQIKTGQIDGKQTDFAGWVARVTKAQLQELMLQLYEDPRDNRFYSGEVLKLYKTIEQLDPDKLYALVAVKQ